jgi:REP element-mobilizing transposase RayT
LLTEDRLWCFHGKAFTSAVSRRYRSCRGAGKSSESDFDDDFDYRKFLEKLEAAVDQFHVRLYLFCLLKNHFHLLAETPIANLSDFMSRLLSGYCIYYNWRHNRSGHVTQARYGAKLVEGDEYLSKLSRYIHLNPVQTKAIKAMDLKERVDFLRRYRWSSSPGYIDRAQRLDFVEYGPVLEMIGAKQRSERSRIYRRYVESGLIERDEEIVEALKAHPRGIGTEQFLEWIDGLHLRELMERKRKENVTLRRSMKHASEEQVLEVLEQEMVIMI